MRFVKTLYGVAAAILFAALMLLALQRTDAEFWIYQTFFPADLAVSDVHRTRMDHFVYGQDARRDLAGTAAGERGYFSLTMRLKVDRLGDTTLFQAGPAGRGVRIAVAGPSLVMIFPGGKTVLIPAIKPGDFYPLEIQAVSGAFLSASVDVVPVMTQADAGLDIATSSFAIGPPPGTVSGFAGQLDYISLTKGAYAPLPWRGAAIVCLGGLLLICLLLFALWRTLDGHLPVRKFLSRLVLVAAPLALTLGFVEYRLSFVNTVYYAKRVALEAQRDKIEVLVTGSSNTVYGADPQFFSRPGFNLAFPANDTYEDSNLIRKYRDRLPRLRMVILTTNFFTSGNYGPSVQSWREEFLRQYFGIPMEPTGTVSDQVRRLPRNFSKIALYGKLITDYAGQDFQMPVDINTRPSGWFDAGDVPASSMEKYAVEAAQVHRVTAEEKYFAPNFAEWDQVVENLQRRNIQVALVGTPDPASYYDNLDPVKVRRMNEEMARFAQHHHIKMHNYMTDPRFSADDFTLKIVDHLNARGAEKFSRILDAEIIRPGLR